MNLDNYVDVATRLKLALERWPDLRIREISHTVEVYNDQTVLVCQVEVYRTPDDPIPSVASASEPLPGKTPFTRDSELMVGMTSALGRALGYMGIGITGSIASKNEVQNRQYGKDEPTVEARPEGPQGPTDAQKRMLRALGHAGPIPTSKIAASSLIDRLKQTKPADRPDTEEDPF
jgi:hypothetical protein